MSGFPGLLCGGFSLFFQATKKGFAADCSSINLTATRPVRRGGGGGALGATAPPPPLLDAFFFFFFFFFACMLVSCYRGWWCTKIPLPHVRKIDPKFLRLVVDLVQNPHPRFQKVSYGPAATTFNTRLIFRMQISVGLWWIHHKLFSPVPAAPVNVNASDSQEKGCCGSTATCLWPV